MGIDLNRVKQFTGIETFEQPELLISALTHPSHTYENCSLTRKQQDQQRLEYRRLAHLGDAILGGVVTDYLHSYCPQDYTAEVMTLLKQDIVSRKNLGDVALNLGIKNCCLLGEGERVKEGWLQAELFGEMYEAVIAAVHINYQRDFLKTRAWLLEQFLRKAVDKEIIIGFDEDFDEENDDFEEETESYVHWSEAIDDPHLLWYYTYVDDCD